MNDVVRICVNDKCFAKAIIDFSKEELDRIKGKKTNEAAIILGKSCKNIFRRENLVLVDCFDVR